MRAEHARLVLLAAIGPRRSCSTHRRLRRAHSYRLSCATLIAGIALAVYSVRSGFGSAIAPVRSPLLRGRHPHLGFAICPSGPMRAQPHRRPDVRSSTRLSPMWGARRAPFSANALTARRSRSPDRHRRRRASHRTEATFSIAPVLAALCAAFCTSSPRVYERSRRRTFERAWPSVRSLSPGSFLIHFIPHGHRPRCPRRSCSAACRTPRPRLPRDRPLSAITAHRRQWPDGATVTYLIRSSSLSGRLFLAERVLPPMLVGAGLFSSGPFRIESRMTTLYPRLFTPLDLGRVLPNRILMGMMPSAES